MADKPLSVYFTKCSESKMERSLMKVRLEMSKFEKAEHLYHSF
jgi:hypothetical protein